MANEGTEPTVIKAYALVIFVNSLSSLMLTRYFTRVLTKQRLLFFDALCDMVYATVPMVQLLVAVGELYRIRNGLYGRGRGGDDDLILGRNMLLSVAETAMQGGHSFCLICVHTYVHVHCECTHAHAQKTRPFHIPICGN